MRLASGAWWYVLPPFLAVLPAFFVHPALGAGSFLLGIGILVFFRDPDRTPPPSGILSPADGRVSVVRREGEQIRVGVFMNVWNVHVNRAPMAGTVGTVDHRPGAHRPAFSKESELNERVVIDFADPDVLVTLIAGAFARRITPYIGPGDPIERGDRIGHIAFGSRADVLLPPDVSREDLRVDRGDRVRAGETVIARKPVADLADNRGDRPSDLP